MTDKTRQIVIIIFAVCGALIASIGGAVGIFMLYTGALHINAGVSAALTAFVVALVNLGVLWIQGKSADLRLQQLEHKIDTRAALTEHKLANGLGNSVAERSADAVIRRTVAKPGGERAYDPPVEPVGFIAVRKDDEQVHETLELRKEQE